MAASLEQGRVVVGYFSTGQAAHGAIQALINDGFLPSEIGAAFHIGAAEGAAGSRESTSAQPNIGGSLREELGTTLSDGAAHGTRVGTSGAASDTSAVQYASLGGGAGTPFDGAGRPKPITGSSLANTGLPSELASELPHDAGLPHGSVPVSSEAPVLSALMPEGSGTVSRAASQESVSVPRSSVSRTESWSERLKHIFSSSSSGKAGINSTYTDKSIPKAPVTKESQDFGTGEGHLILDSGKRYSRPAFERSFSGYGVQPEHARHLASSIGQGGAIVTVHAMARTMEAERILEAHGGEVRFSAGENARPGLDDGESLVEVLGTVDRDYTGYYD